MKTYNVKLKFENSEDERRLQKTLEVQRECWNFVSELFYEHNPVGMKGLHHLTYGPAREKFDLPSQYVIRSQDDVRAAYKTAKSNKQKPISAFVKKRLSVRLDKRLYSLGENSIRVTACDGPKITLSFRPYKKLQEFLDTSVPCDPLIFERDGEFWLSLSFKHEPKPIRETKVLGVDLGEKRLATTSDGQIFVDRKFNKERRKLRYLKRCLKSKNSKSAEKHLRKLKRKERNKTKNQCHHVANQILKTDADVIAVEDLKNLKDKSFRQNKPKGEHGRNRNNAISQVPYYQLVEILTYKAEYAGKRVVKVSPFNTSKKDSRGLKDGNRCGRRYYAKDGKVLDADVNAAINIANKYARGKLHVSSIEPLDGSIRLVGQAGVNQPTESRSLKTDRQVSLGEGLEAWPLTHSTQAQSLVG